MQTQDLAKQLYAYAVNHPAGFTNEQAAADLGITLYEFNRAVRKLRIVLAKDSITLVCDPAGMSQRWIYRLVGTVEHGSPWVKNRLKDTETRLTTMAAAAKTFVNATDGRSVEGRRARVTEKALRRLVEDLEDLASEAKP